MTNQILTYISSSEFNRCKRNGLNLLEPRKCWFDVLKYEWLTRKLRRKIGHLLQLDLLPVIYQPIIGLNDVDYSIFDLPQFKDMSMIMAKKYMDAEDEAIMEGVGK
jgi:hypothetical protein